MIYMSILNANQNCGSNLTVVICIYREDLATHCQIISKKIIDGMLKYWKHQLTQISDKSDKITIEGEIILMVIIINNLLNSGQFGFWREPHFEFSFCIWIQSYLYHPQKFFVPFLVPKNWHYSKRHNSLEKIGYFVWSNQLSKG